MRDEFQRRRDVFVAGLNKIKGFSCRMPKGAFYVSPTSRKQDGSRNRWPTHYWEQAGGRRVVRHRLRRFGEGYLRFSVANSLENLQAGARAA